MTPAPAKEMVRWRAVRRTGEFVPLQRPGAEIPSAASETHLRRGSPQRFPAVVKPMARSRGRETRFCAAATTYFSVPPRHTVGRKTGPPLRYPRRSTMEVDRSRDRPSFHGVVDTVARPTRPALRAWRVW